MVQLTSIGAWPFGTTTEHAAGEQQVQPDGDGGVGGGGGGVGAGDVGAGVGCTLDSRLTVWYVYAAPGPMCPGVEFPDPGGGRGRVEVASVMSDAMIGHKVACHAMLLTQWQPQRLVWFSGGCGGMFVAMVMSLDATHGHVIRVAGDCVGGGHTVSKC